MVITKDLTYNIESRRDIFYVKLSWRVYNRLSEENQKLYWELFEKVPEYENINTNMYRTDKRIIPIRQYVGDLALWVYAKSKKQYSLKKSFRYAYKHLEKLLHQLQNTENTLKIYGTTKNRYLAKQFLFHGFVPISEAPDIKEGDGNSYITSSMSINGITYIYPHKLNMAHRPGKSPDRRFLWYHFEGGMRISGHTRAWYSNELKYLKKQQNDQRNSS